MGSYLARSIDIINIIIVNKILLGEDNDALFKVNGLFLPI